MPAIRQIKGKSNRRPKVQPVDASKCDPEWIRAFIRAIGDEESRRAFIQSLGRDAEQYAKEIPALPIDAMSLVADQEKLRIIRLLVGSISYQSMECSRDYASKSLAAIYEALKAVDVLIQRKYRQFALAAIDYAEQIERAQNDKVQTNLRKNAGRK